MKHRHKAHGGKASGPQGDSLMPKHKKPHEEVSSSVEKEAEEKKRGGRAYKAGGKVPGFKHGGRLDKRARGGGVGSDKHPFSSAHRGN